MQQRRDSLVLELSCPVDAPLQRVFGLLAEPADLARWFGPHGFTVASVDLDLRIGGGYRFTMQPPDGEAFHISGKFREIEPPNRLAYTFRYEEPTLTDRETLVRLVLEPADDGTRLFMRQEGFATEERRDLHAGGWGDSLEKLRDLARLD